MARYETVLTVPLPLAETFAFVSDFRNASRWDPRTYSAEKATDGPIGVGTRFVLRGGLLPEEVARRFRLPVGLATMPLPYDVVAFDAPNEFVLEGETRLVRYRDHLEFSADEGITHLRYLAELTLKGPLAVGEAMMRRMFQRIGDDATKDLAAVVAEGS